MNARALLGVLLGGCSLSMAYPARAEPSPYLGRDNPLMQLLPSAAALSASERSRREQAIEHALMGLAGVRRAAVLIRQPSAGATPLDQPLPDYEVEVRLEQSGTGPSALAVEHAARTALPDLKAERLRVTRVAQATRPAEPVALARVGPFVVARESSAPLRLTLAFCLGANALLATLLLVRRRAR